VNGGPGFFVRLLNHVGVLRMMLYGLTVAIILFAPFSGGEVVYSGRAMVPSLIVPALVPIVFFVLMLDLMMSAVFRADARGDARRRYGHLVATSLVLGMLLLASWLPFYLALGNGTAPEDCWWAELSPINVPGKKAVYIKVVLNI